MGKVHLPFQTKSRVLSHTETFFTFVYKSHQCHRCKRFNLRFLHRCLVHRCNFSKLFDDCEWHLTDCQQSDVPVFVRMLDFWWAECRDPKDFSKRILAMCIQSCKVCSTLHKLFFCFRAQRSLLLLWQKSFKQQFNIFTSYPHLVTTTTNFAFAVRTHGDIILSIMLNL